MKKRKFKGYVLPTLYMLITISIFTSIVLLGSNFKLQDMNYDYGLDILKDNVENVLNEDVEASSDIKSPVEDDKATIEIHFYEKDVDEKIQQSSLIYYENIYLPNTGVIYTADNSFLVKSIFSGTVVEILDDEFFGKYVVVEHKDNIRSYYYGLEELEVSVGDEITTGTIIGTSKNNEILKNKNSFLLEVYYNNELINPEHFVGSKITDYE